ncbi:MAG: TonB-dependent siderophore receptor [Burkholderiales bacterium]|nr:MAG: TonB-dependent siderophore receptor [Burkholderiales bacterium]
MAFFSPVIRAASRRPSLPSLHPSSPRRTPVALAAIAALLAAGAATAQQESPSLKPVTINAQTTSPQTDVSGFGDVPAREVPMSTVIVTQDRLQAAGIRRLSDITRIDPSSTDSYNSAGYWDFLTIRGYTLSNRFNYRREGLPITAETSIPLDNKERVELLKGTSGIQAGTSAPGGLVNYVVKRPTEKDLRVARIEFSERGSVLAAADLGGRFGEDARFGYRLNAAHESLRPNLRSADGSRDLLSLATDWRLTRDSILQAEVEWSRKSQPSQAAFSLLGNVLPAPPDPRLNLNNQPWAQPVVFEGLTGTVRFDQALSRDWRWSAQLGTQRLKTDDRESFPFGCGAEGNYDRYCSDGTYDIYDFRSEGERRRYHAGKLSIQGTVNTGAVKHDLTLGLLRSRAIERYNQQAFNYVGTGNVAGTLVVPPDPTLYDTLGARNEQSTELFAYDTVSWNAWRGWVGLRHTQLSRDSVQTDGTGATSYSQSFSTPWLGLSYLWGDKVIYASAGQGVESFVTPNKPGYVNAGQALSAVKSRQVEVGLRGGDARTGWSVAWFAVRRPAVTDDGTNYQVDGTAKHQGLEAQYNVSQGPWRAGVGAMFLKARREDSSLNPLVNGLRPVNVPEQTLRAEVGWQVPGVTGLELDARVVREGNRAILSDNTLMLPAWTRVDAGATWRTKASGADLSFRLAVDNVSDKRYWRESPFQFGHYYLYPGAARTIRFSIQAAL